MHQRFSSLCAQVSELEDFISQRPVLRQHLRHAAAYHAADGPLLRQAVEQLLDCAFPEPAIDSNFGCDVANDAFALTPLDAEVCVEVCIAGGFSSAHGKRLGRGLFSKPVFVAPSILTKT